MVWSGFCPKGRLDIAFILTRINSFDYSEVFSVQLLFFENQRNGILLIFQQNNAAIHDGRSKTAWFVDNNMTVMASLTCQSSYADRGVEIFHEGDNRTCIPTNTLINPAVAKVSNVKSAYLRLFRLRRL
ncbi:hypothetical protein Y032_0049g1858 [Ancylostoma ceylanicum]|uniref:Uncharacterized protein n=1 Tax=Ancylostoma ceylanicum TaxID=53326 RepID=A0A016UAQ3_9BILA|nr:hypothetical protein Y032_0049g1858 [Ancylostoma ceylanicum]